MRKARYDMKQVVCPRASCIGYSSNIAKPGYWVRFDSGSGGVGRVLGRIAETDRDGRNCAGYLAVMAVNVTLAHAHVIWCAPSEIAECYEKPPHDLLAWITGGEWVKNKGDIARLIAMGQHGTLSESYINNRDNPEAAYNRSPEYVQQWILS